MSAPATNQANTSSDHGTGKAPSSTDAAPPSASTAQGSAAAGGSSSSSAGAAGGSGSSSSSSTKRPISYAAERVIGTGSFGVVYQATVIESGDEARSLHAGESVAIKKVLQDRRFKNRELQIMSMLNHPNLIGLRHCFYSKGDPTSAKDADSLYLNLVMQYVPSTIHRTLRDHAKANRLVPMFLTRLYVWQMCRAVHYIHTIGVCHRDIKPQNVLLNNKTYEVSLCLAYGTPVLLATGAVCAVEQLSAETDQLVSPTGEKLEIQGLDKSGVSETMYTITFDKQAVAAASSPSSTFHSHSVTPHHQIPYRRLVHGRWQAETASAADLFQRFQSLDARTREREYRLYKPNRALDLSSPSSEWFSKAVSAATLALSSSSAIPSTPLAPAAIDLAAWALGVWLSAADASVVLQRRDLSPLLHDRTTAADLAHFLLTLTRTLAVDATPSAAAPAVLGRMMVESLSIRRAFLCGWIDGSRGLTEDAALAFTLAISSAEERARVVRFLRLLGLHATSRDAADDRCTFAFGHDDASYLDETLAMAISNLTMPPPHTANGAPSDLFQSPFDISVATVTKQYVTFQVKGSLYLLGDLTVTHNCDFGCLIDGTLVLRADGTSVPCEQVKAGDVLLGVDTPTVVVDQVQASMPRNEVWVVTHKQPTRSYTVSSEHRLTLASRRSPSIAVERVGGQWRVRVCWMAAGGKWRTEQFTVDIADDDEEAQAEEDIFTEEEELMLMQANELPVDELDAARPEPTPIGTRRRLIEAAKAKYLSDRSQFLLRGELFEISPVQLQERWKLYDMAAPDKAKAGAVRLPVDESAEEEEEVATEVVQPRAIQSSGNVVTDASLAAQKEVLAVASAIVGHDQVAPIFTYSAIGGGKYEAIEAGVPVECVYQLPTPLSVSAALGDTAHACKSSSFLNLERIHACLGVSMTSAAGIVLTAMNPIPGSVVSEIASARSSYDRLCQTSIEHVLTYRTKSVVAFGSACRLRWMEWCELRRKAGEIRAYEEQWIGGIHRVQFEREVPSSGDAPGVPQWQSTSVFFAPEPSQWEQTRVITKAIALVHGAPYVDVCLSEKMTTAIRKVERKEGDQPFKVTNIVINSPTDAGRRYVLSGQAGGVVTHNSAKMLNPAEPNVSYICSRYYRAPELVFEATSYTTAIDIWSLGAVFGELLLGSPLFPGDSSVDQLIEIIKVLGSPTKEDIFAMNPANNFRFPLIQTAVWSKTFRGKAPPDAIDLISLMLKYDPKARILPLDALAHPFFDPLRLANAGAASVSGLSKDIVLPPTLFAFTDEELRTMQKRGTLLKIVPPHLLPTLQMPTTTDTQ